MIMDLNAMNNDKLMIAFDDQSLGLMRLLPVIPTDLTWHPGKRHSIQQLCHTQPALT